MTSNTTATTAKIYIPVNEYVLNKILKAMKLVDVIWDGTVNHIDRFCFDQRCHDWLRLTPSKSTKKVVYISYVP